MRFTPMGYDIQRGGTAVGIIFGVFSAVLMTVLLVGGGGIIQASPFMVMGAVFLIGGPLSDYTVNRKAKIRIAYREEMMTKLCIKGKILRVEKKGYYFGKEFKYDYATRSKNTVNRFVVQFEDPYTHEEREAVSEKYANYMIHEMIKGTFKIANSYDEEYADVYVSEDGSTWVEPIYKDPNLQ